MLQQLGGLNSICSTWSRRLEIPDQGVSRLGSAESLCLGCRQLAAFPLHPHVAERTETEMERHTQTDPDTETQAALVSR